MTRCPLCDRRAELAHVSVEGSRIHLCAACIGRGRACGYSIEAVPDGPRREEAEAFARAVEDQAAIVARQAPEPVYSAPMTWYRRVPARQRARARSRRRYQRTLAEAAA